MTDKELEQRLAQALDRAAPQDVEEVLSRCTARKGRVVPMTKQVGKQTKWRPLIAACLALALLGGGGGVFYQQTYAVASVVSLDVNPSVELKVNQKEKVLSCTPLNQEAREVLAEMDGGADLKGTGLEVAVNAIMGALVRHGYLDGLSSAILISVEDQNQDRAAKLQRELTQSVDAALQGRTTAVLSQTLSKDTGLEAQAQQNHVSTGKAYLVNQVAAQTGAAFDKVSQLSVEELKDLAETGEKRLPIGCQAAAETAEKYAGVQGCTTEVDPELDETPACYEVELHHPTLGEFEYRVDAFTGGVLSGQKNITAVTKSQNQTAQQQATQSQTATQTVIGAAKAKEIALNHAGVQASQASFDEVELDREHGRTIYELEFYAGGVEYSYEIDAASGAVVDFEREQEEHHDHH